MTEGAKQPEAYNHSVNLYWQELERWAGSGHSLRCAWTSAVRTEPPFAHAAFAGAETARRRGMVLAVKQHVSSERSFKASLKGKCIPPFRRNRGRQTRSGTFLPFAHAVIADAAIDRRCGTLIIALHPTLPGRPLKLGLTFNIQTVLSLLG